MGVIKARYLYLFIGNRRYHNAHYWWQLSVTGKMPVTDVGLFVSCNAWLVTGSMPVTNDHPCPLRMTVFHIVSESRRCMPSFGPIPIGGLVQSQTASFWLRTLVPCGDSNCHAWGGIGAGWFLHLAPMSFCNLTSMLPHWCWLVPPVGNNGCRPYKADSSSSPTRATLVCSWLSFHGGRWCTISPSKLIVTSWNFSRNDSNAKMWISKFRFEIECIIKM
jgi:hypothetical protein